eukprot:GHVU01040361.1.p1 GENE.GHVU01040361.1~~GHVU01040361.1.p1  ORF type:complete len:180 (+),score=37.58 GHVU01040361.1:62-601(+)
MSTGKKGSAKPQEAIAGKAAPKKGKVAVIKGKDKSKDKADKAAKAKQAAKAIKQTKKTSLHKVRTKLRFRRPKTLHHQRKPLYPARSLLQPSTVDPYKVIKAPLTTESAMRCIEDLNTIAFICYPRSTKYDIKRAVKALYKVDAERINTLIRPDGQKKAYVRIAAPIEALDIANKMGLL